MNRFKLSTAAILVSFLLGCSSKDSPEPAPPRKTVFDPLTQDLDRARAAQQTIDQGAARERAAIDAEERGDKSP